MPDKLPAGPAIADAKGTILGDAALHADILTPAADVEFQRIYDSHNPANNREAEQIRD